MFKGLLFLHLILCTSGAAQSMFEGLEHLFTQPRSYVILRSIDSIVVDGTASELSWVKAPWSNYFVDIEGNRKPTPPLTTRFKMLWSASILYIYAELQEPNLWSVLTKRDDLIYNDNDFEVFIDPDGDTHHYYEIEVNVLNTVFDLYLEKPYRNGGKAIKQWDAGGLTTAVSADGTVNNPTDTDKGWSVEIAIPFSALTDARSEAGPKDGTIWRMNFSRVQWNLDVDNNNYLRKLDANNRLLPENNYVWSEQGVVNMHFPERWGYVQFTSQRVGTTTAAHSIPPIETAKQYLWLVYYKQKDFYTSNRRYADRLTLLGFQSEIIESRMESCRISLQALEHEFSATITCEGEAADRPWQINHEGLITRR